MTFLSNLPTLVFGIWLTISRISSRVISAPGLGGDDHEGPLLPLGVLEPDDGGLGNGGMAEQRVFHVDRRDPLAAALDDVLEPVGHLEEAVGRVRWRNTVVAGRDPRPTHADLACGEPSHGTSSPSPLTMRMSTPVTGKPCLRFSSTSSSSQSRSRTLGL